MKCNLNLGNSCHIKLSLIIKYCESKHSIYKVKFLIIFLLTLSSCASTYNNQNDSNLNVGAIVFDKSIDNPKFKVCDENRILEYYNFGKGFQYKGEKNKLIQIYESKLKYRTIYKESGYITIRFIVNCLGLSGRFRVQEMDLNYHPKKFKKKFATYLLDITSQLDGWVIGKLNGNAFDYYQYLTFKIVDGKLIEIKP